MPTRVLVVGAGVFGSWSAKFFADRGYRVTVVDAYGPANGRASSADHSRVIRAGYGADEIYSRWATAALRDWHWLSSAAGQSLVVPTGALFLGPAGSAYLADTLATLTRLGLAPEMIDPSSLQQRHPQLVTDGLGPAVFEPGAGVLRARAAVQALVALLQRQQQIEFVAARVLPPDEQAARLAVQSAAGTVFEADVYVFACGPWLSALLPQAVGARIRATRQEVLYFGTPAGSTGFSAGRLPVWIDFTAGVYGIPDLDAVGFKVGIDRHGPPIDPDTSDRVVDPRVIAETRGWIAHRFPSLARAPIVETRVCQYENTATGDFVIDTHPMWPDCWIVGGGSGHGFKHGPAVGRYLVAQVTGEAAREGRFGLQGTRQTAARAVY